MFLNIIKTPTSGNVGSSNIICGGITVPLTLNDATGQGIGTMVSFYHLDEEGKTWNVVSDNYKGVDYFSYGFLIKNGEKYCTIVNGKLEIIGENTPKAADFYEFGILEPPVSEILSIIDSPRVLYWRAGGSDQALKNVVKAYLYPHTIRCSVDMSHISILGIMMMTGQYSGNVRVKYSLDNGESFTEEITMDEWLNTNVVELWNRLPENRVMLLDFILHDNATISRFKIIYEN